MVPTLNIEDRVLVIKNTIINNEIDYGDIVVFYSPESDYKKNLNKEIFESFMVWKIFDKSSDLHTALIKRVVGLSGDEVLIKANGEVFVNDIKFVVPNIEQGTYLTEQTYLVPENEIFLLGDNRINSQDSRYIGTVSINNVLGKAHYIIYPFDNFTNLDD